MSEYAIQMLGITKTFPGIIANDNVNLEVRKNEVLAILGENGAGKSTLMSVLFGAYPPDAGKILINGKEEKITDPNVATKLGIGMVHQHFKLVHNYTVTENIVLGREPRNKAGILSLKDAEKRVGELSDKYGLMVDPRAKIDDITVGQQQRVEILKTLYSDSDIIILDEPTVGLDPKQIMEMRDLIRGLAKKHTVILSTHIMQEVSALCDEVLIIAHGELIAKDTPDNLSKHVSGSNTLELLVKAPDYKVKAILSKVSDVSKFELADTEENEYTKVFVSSSADKDVRENVFYAFATAKCPIVSMQYSSLSLEDVFIKVTEGKQTDRRKRKEAK